MRSLKSIYTIPAHKSAVSDLKFFRPSSGASASTVPRGLSKLSALGLPVVKVEGEPTASDRDPMELDGEEGAVVDVPTSGSFLVSSGYDGYVKIWSADDWQLVKSMTSDAGGKVMSVDVSSGTSLLLSVSQTRSRKLTLIERMLIDARFLASAEYSRTYKLWSSPDVDLS
jgi:U4/U6 small nuclear ribonucleoprotein PRP4